MVKPNSLTTKERIIMEYLVEAWDGFLELDKQHSSENTDFMNGIHQLQGILGMRILRREHPDVFPVKIKEER